MTVPNGEPGINPPDFGVTNDGTIPNLPARSQTVAENFYKGRVQDSPSWIASTPIFSAVVNMFIAAFLKLIGDAIPEWVPFGDDIEDAIDGWADNISGQAQATITAQQTADSKSKVTKGTSAPSSPAVSDMWIDTTTGSNVYKVWNGSAWVVTTDKIAIDAANDAAAAVTTANTANTTANTAQTAANEVGNQVTVVASQVVTAQSVFIAASSRPLYDGPDPTADYTVPMAILMERTTATDGTHTHDDNLDVPSASGTHSGHTSGTGSHDHSLTGSVLSTNSQHAHVINPPTLTVNATTAWWGYMRVSVIGAEQRRVITYAASKTGTVTTVNLDLYQQEDDGSVSLIYSSANIAGDITATMTDLQHLITSPVTVNPSEIYAIQMRMTGAGSVTLAGITLMARDPVTGFYPKKIGLSRNPTTAAPSTIATATLDGLFSNSVPWFGFGMDLGAIGAPRSYADDFNRSDIGGLWLRGNIKRYWYQIGGQSNFNISSNMLTFQGGVDGWQYGVRSQNLATDHQRAEVIAGTPTALWTTCAICSDENFANYAAIQYNATQTRIVSGAGPSTWTQRAITTTTNISGTEYDIEYNNGTNTYAVYKDGSGSSLITWTDSGNVVTHGSSKRRGGIVLERDNFVNSGPVNSCIFYDV